MKKLALATVLLLAPFAVLGGCKKASRKQICSDNQGAFDRGIEQAVRLNMIGASAEAKVLADAKVALAKKNFMDFCMGLTEAEMKCMSNQDSTSPTCAHVMNLVKTKLLGE